MNADLQLPLFCFKFIKTIWEIMHIKTDIYISFKGISCFLTVCFKKKIRINIFCFWLVRRINNVFLYVKLHFSILDIHKVTFCCQKYLPTWFDLHIKLVTSHFFVNRLPYNIDPTLKLLTTLTPLGRLSTRYRSIFIVIH